ncbi:hypothetical protein PINS_up004084 [Pythium insidiosum]|nr:hypothetical protein PINS_up004084 [Pythium insidiosum]
MKRSFDHVATPSADEGRPDEPLALLLSSTPSCLLRVPSPQKLQELAASVATQQPQDWDSHQASTTVVAARLGHNASTRRLRRRTCDLEVALREEGLIRLVFSFLNVAEHQRIKSCCRSWMKLIQTLALDTLDMSSQSPLTSATIDRAFLSVIHNYSTVRRIDMSGQRSLNDRDLLVLTSCFWSHLEHIVIDDCIDVTDFGLLSILNAQSQRLQSISIRHCKQITGSFSHEQITGRHPSLTTLDVTDTRIPYSVVHGLEHVFPSLQTIHATHTPAHLDCLRLLGWEDLVDELLFLVSNEMSDLPHIDALLEQFACRVSRWRREEEASGRPVSVLHRSLFALGARALLDVPLRRADLMSALLYACENGLTNIIPALVAHGRSDVEATDKDGASALCIAVTNGLTDVARLLLDAGADINKRTRCLATPLYIASEMNWEDVVELLLAYNATPTCPVIGGATALCVAAKNGNHASVLRLLAAERTHESKLPMTSRRRRASLTAAPRPHHVQSLFLACERGHVAIARDILELTKLDTNVLMDNSVSPLYLACQMGHDEIVELLLNRGANPNFRRPNGGVSCLYIAAQEGKERIVELLVRYSVNIHARMDDLSTALHIAARMGHIRVAEVLLREGSCIDDQTRSGLTPLYIASEEGHHEMVQFFLHHGADMDLQTKNGTTPLFVASQKGHTQVVRALLMAGANTHLPKHNGTYPMDAASLLGNYEVTQLLLQFGARVGGLSLHFAERRRDLRLQALLMDRYYEQHFQRLGGVCLENRPSTVLS